MNTSDRMQPSRFELKYLLSEATAQRVRDFVRAYLSTDEHGRQSADGAYPVHSLYLDSNNLDIYWQNVNGDKNRFKLRLRYYDDATHSPVFFEIKRRLKDTVQKERAAVKREAVPVLLGGAFPGPEHLLVDTVGGLSALQKFSHLMMRLEARPKSHILYKREAYVSDNDGVRVTLDRDIYSEPHLENSVRLRMENPVQSFPGLIILELKFAQRFPNWFRELVRMANVMQCGAAKYAASVRQIGRRRLGAHAEVLEEESLLSTYRAGDDLPTVLRDDRSAGTPPISGR